MNSVNVPRQTTGRHSASCVNCGTKSVMGASRLVRCAGPSAGAVNLRRNTTYSRPARLVRLVPKIQERRRVNGETLYALNAGTDPKVAVLSQSRSISFQ